MDKKEFVESIKEDLGIKTYQEMGKNANMELNFDMDNSEINELRRIFYKKKKNNNKK